jgi:hypothetical protein
LTEFTRWHPKKRNDIASYKMLRGWASTSPHKYKVSNTVKIRVAIQIRHPLQIRWCNWDDRSCTSHKHFKHTSCNWHNAPDSAATFEKFIDMRFIHPHRLILLVSTESYYALTINFQLHVCLNCNFQLFFSQPHAAWSNHSFFYFISNILLHYLTTSHVIIGSCSFTVVLSY